MAESPSMAESAGKKGGRRAILPSRGGIKAKLWSTLNKSAGAIFGSGKAKPNQDMVEAAAGSSKAECTAIKVGRGEDEPARLNRLPTESEALSVDNVFLSCRGSEAKPNQDMVKAAAGSSKAECTAIKGGRGEDEPARLNRETIELEAESVYDATLSCRGSEAKPNQDMVKAAAGSSKAECTAIKGGRGEDEPARLNRLPTEGALYKHKQSWGDEKVERWKKALVEAGKIKGWELSSYKSEGALITAIVAEILFKLMIEHNYVSEDLSTGDNPVLSDRTSEHEDSQESKIMELLELEGIDHLNTDEAGFEILPNTTILSLGLANVGGQFADALLNMERLKVLNLTGCADLLVTPSFSCYPNLEILILERCSRLVHLDPSINDLKLLVTLNLKFCSELSMLPVEMDGMNALEELLIDGTSKPWPVKEDINEEEDSEETEEDQENVEGWRYAENNEDDDEETEYED
ncbi:hypothetical protein NL676_039602 [Syzygium grande]|nr:hypothetical protein NL676_039602 [Syzygium grande]